MWGVRFSLKGFCIFLTEKRSNDSDSLSPEHTAKVDEHVTGGNHFREVNKNEL